VISEIGKLNVYINAAVASL